GLDDLLDYTDWQRAQWQALLQKQGAGALAVSAGAHGDGRFRTIGDLIRHVFSAEKRYVDRLSGRAVTDTAVVPTHHVGRVFAFGRESRQDLRSFVASFPDAKWEVPQEMVLMDYRLRITPRKIIAHVVLHEIRHWAQIATLARLGSVPVGFQDFLFSPVFGGE